MKNTINPTSVPKDGNNFSKSNTTIFLIVALVTSIFANGAIGLISDVCGLYAAYLIYKQRKDFAIPKKTKILRIILLIIWVLLYTFFYTLKLPSK